MSTTSLGQYRRDGTATFRTSVVLWIETMRKPGVEGAAGPVCNNGYHFSMSTNLEIRHTVHALR